MSVKRFLLILSIGMCIAFPGFSTDWASIVEDGGKAVAKISVSDDKGAIISQGTGFVIQNLDGNQRLVTNAHVVGEAEHSPDFTITAEFLFTNEDTDNHYLLSIDIIDRELDLCLLSLDREAQGFLEISSETTPALMDEILIIGYPLGRNFKTTPGYLQAYQDIDGMGSMMDLSASVAPGNSGGPVLNKAGKVIGVVTAVIPGYNFNLAIPALNLGSFIRKETSQFDFLINSTPDNAWVFIDGNYKGKTPLKVTLFNREYKLKIEKEGSMNYDEIIGPWEGQVQDLNISLMEKEDTNPIIEIIVEPEGAEVFVNNLSLGDAPVSGRFPAGSIMRIRVEKWGYKEKLEFYEVTEASEQRLELKLKRKFLW